MDINPTANDDAGKKIRTYEAQHREVKSTLEWKTTEAGRMSVIGFTSRKPQKFGIFEDFEPCLNAKRNKRVAG